MHSNSLPKRLLSRGRTHIHDSLSLQFPFRLRRLVLVVVGFHKGYSSFGMPNEQKYTATQQIVLLATPSIYLDIFSFHVEPVLVPSRLLSLVHCPIGVLKNGVDIRAMIGIERDTDAAGDD